MKICKKCGSSESYKDGHCKPCKMISNRNRKKPDPEKVKACYAIRYKANYEKINARNAAWAKANPEKKKGCEAAWRKANSEKVKTKNDAWSKANPEKIKAASRKWAKANPEAKRIQKHRRRVKERTNGGELSRGLSAKLFKLQRGKCACCRGHLKEYHLDHKMPLALEGSNTDDNIQLLCPTCNRQKSAKHPIDFMQSRGFLL